MREGIDKKKSHRITGGEETCFHIQDGKIYYVQVATQNIRDKQNHLDQYKNVFILLDGIKLIGNAKI